MSRENESRSPVSPSRPKDQQCISEVCTHLAKVFDSLASVYDDKNSDGYRRNAYAATECRNALSYDWFSDFKPGVQQTTETHEHECVHHETNHAGRCKCRCGAWRDTWPPSEWSITELAGASPSDPAQTTETTRQIVRVAGAGFVEVRCQHCDKPMALARPDTGLYLCGNINCVPPKGLSVSRERLREQIAADREDCITVAPVHNHGPVEGLGPDCRERIVDGQLKGECLGASPSYPPAQPAWVPICAKCSATAVLNDGDVCENCRSETPKLPEPMPEGTVTISRAEYDALFAIAAAASPVTDTPGSVPPTPEPPPETDNWREWDGERVDDAFFKGIGMPNAVTSVEPAFPGCLVIVVSDDEYQSAIEKFFQSPTPKDATDDEREKWVRMIIESFRDAPNPSVDIAVEEIMMTFASRSGPPKEDTEQLHDSHEWTDPAGIGDLRCDRCGIGASTNPTAAAALCGEPERTWLMASLRKSAEEAKRLPRWAIEVNRAVEEFYARGSSPESASVPGPQQEPSA